MSRNKYVKGPQKDSTYAPSSGRFNSQKSNFSNKPKSNVRRDIDPRAKNDWPEPDAAAIASAEEELRKAVLKYCAAFKMMPDNYTSLQYCFANDLVLFRDKQIDIRIDPLEGFHEVSKVE